MISILGSIIILIFCGSTVSMPNGDILVQDSNNASTVDNKIPFIVYYEALCWDSVNFIKNQLYPAWQQHKKYMEIQLVPYGKASVIMLITC